MKISYHETDRDWVADIEWDGVDYIVEGDLDGWEPVVVNIFADAGEDFACDNIPMTEALKPKLVDAISIAAVELELELLEYEAKEAETDRIIQNAIDDGYFDRGVI